MNNDGVLYSNHFHRLLSFVEVPTRTHRQLGNPLEIKRVPGKINLNGVRDPRVMASLIDDRNVTSPPERDVNNNKILDASEDFNGNTEDTNYNGVLDPGEDTNMNGVIDGLDSGLPDLTGESSRDWWYQFLVARDGQIPLDPTQAFDPIMNPANKMLPPLPMGGISQPFRDLGILNPAQQLDTSKSPNLVVSKSPIQNTLLRTLYQQNGPISPISPTGRRLFELATENEFTNNQVDPYIRHRLLSKIINNTTNRSNVFVVYVTIGMFECLELPSGAVRIGGQMDVDGDGQKDTHRAVFIIDRSQAEEAFDPTTGTFDWQKLVKARQRIN